MTPTHDGCAYQHRTDRHRGCLPAETCPAGYQVYRKWTGGGHHHAWETTNMVGKVNRDG